MATLTRIQGYLYDATGTVVTSGQLRVTAQDDFVSVDGTKVIPFTEVIDLSDTAGLIDIELYAMDGATPAGLAYFVEFDPDPDDLTKPMKSKDGYWNNYWAVPNTTAIVPIGQFVSALRGTPAANYMPLSGSLNTSSDSLTLGTTADTDKRIISNGPFSAKPEIRFNATTDVWEFSNDGVLFEPIGSADSVSSGDTLTLGTTPANTTKQIIANQNSTDKPKIRYNNTTGKWEFSHNGLSFFEMAGASAGATTVVESEISLSDNTTNDVSTSKHGFIPKAPNDAAKVFRGDGTWAHAFVGSLLDYKFVRKTANESVTSSAVIQNDNHLAFTIGANEVWIVDCFLLVDGPTTGDIIWAWSAPAGSSGAHGGIRLLSSVTGSSGDIQAVMSTDLTTTRAAGTAGVGTVTLIPAKAIVVNGANAGTVTLQWAQSVADGTATTVYTNSYLEARRVA